MDFPPVVLQRIQSKSSQTLCHYPPGIPIPIEVWVLSLGPQSPKERQAVVFHTLVHVCVVLTELRIIYNGDRLKSIFEIPRTLIYSTRTRVCVSAFGLFRSLPSPFRWTRVTKTLGTRWFLPTIFPPQSCDEEKTTSR